MKRSYTDSDDIGDEDIGNEDIGDNGFKSAEQS